MHLCKECFVRIFERRVEKCIKKYRMRGKNEKIWVALSGGKDSLVALYVLKKFSDSELYAYHINLGIEGYSERMEEVSREFAKKMNVPLKITDLEDEYGIAVAKFARKKTCAVCGTIKRYLMNKIPREEGATMLATGHNADDIMDFFVKNFLARNYHWNRKLVPRIEGEHPKLLTKIRPLYFVGDREVATYALINEIPVEREECPYAKFSGWKEIFYEIEKKKKYFRTEMINSIAIAAEFFPEEERELRECKICGEPSNNEICGFCRILNNTKIDS